MLVGNPLAGRGCKVPNFCDSIGIRRMDIFWVDNEQTMRSDMVRIQKFISREGWKPEELGEHKEEIIEHFEMGDDDYPFGGFLTSSLQSRIFDANLGKDQTIRFYIGELNLMSEEHIQKDLIEAYEPIPVGLVQNSLTSHPVMGEYIRDLIGALQLDGMSKAEAMNEVVKWGEAKPEELEGQFQKPKHYYKIKDEYYFAYND
jgi:hypothetical protein